MYFHLVQLQLDSDVCTRVRTRVPMVEDGAIYGGAIAAGATGVTLAKTHCPAHFGFSFAHLKKKT